MSKRAHTPGPWRKNQYGNLVCYPEGLEIGLLSKQLPPEEVEANENLIIAAPDLLEALRYLNVAGEDIVGGTANHIIVRLPVKAITQAATAIAKAEGRP